MALHGATAKIGLSTIKVKSFLSVADIGHFSRGLREEAPVFPWSP